MGFSCRAGDPGVAPVPLQRRAPIAEGKAPGPVYASRRIRAGHAALVLPLEQHARRRAVRAGREGTLRKNLEAPGAPDAGRSRSRRRWSRTSPASGSSCAISTRPTPDAERFPPFDEAPARRRCGPRPSCSSRTCMREDRSVLDLLDADYTFVNERLARHYGIAGVRARISPRVAGRTTARRRADPGERADGHLEPDADLAGQAGQVDPGEHPRATPPPPPPPDVPQLARIARRSADRLAPRAHGAAPREPQLRRLPPARWTRSASPWRTSTPSAPGATKDGDVPHRRLGRAARRPDVHGPGRAEEDPPRHQAARTSSAAWPRKC